MYIVSLQSLVYYRLYRLYGAIKPIIDKRLQ